MSKELLEELMDAIAYLRDEYVDAEMVSECYGHDITAEIAGCPTSALSYTGDYIELLQKRVQELEEIIYQDERQAVLEGMYEQKERYREAIKKAKNAMSLVVGGEGSATKTAHNILREALEE